MPQAGSSLIIPGPLSSCYSITGVCLLQTPKARSTRSIQASHLSTCLQELPLGATFDRRGARLSNDADALLYLGPVPPKNLRPPATFLRAPGCPPATAG